MITSFDTGNDQLRRLDEQAELMRLAGEETNQPVLVEAAKVLEKVKFESYLELCEVVGADPNLIRFYHGALERVELVLYVVDRQAEAEPASPSTHLGQLAVSASSEESELMAFFELFAPSDETFLRYKETRAASQAISRVTEPVVEIAAPKPDTASGVVATEEAIRQPDTTVHLADETASVEAGNATPQPASAEAGTETVVTGDEPATDSDLQEPEPTSESEPKRVASKVKVNGEVVDLVRTATVMLQIMDEQGGKNIKSTVFHSDPRFLEAVKATTRKGSKHLNPTGRIKSTFLLLDGKFPGITYKTGPQVGPGAMRNLSDDYKIEFIFDDQPTDKVAGNGEPIPADNERAASPTAETDESAEWANPVAEQPATGIFTETDSIRARFAGIQSRAEATTYIELTPQMTSRTKLVADGYMIDGRRTDFTDEERELVRCISNSPRKAPITPASLAESLRGRNGSGSLSAEEVDSILTDLSSRLPKGWLVKVPGARPEQPAGWRFASRIGIKQQGRKAKKDSAK